MSASLSINKPLRKLNISELVVSQSAEKLSNKLEATLFVKVVC